MIVWFEFWLAWSALIAGNYRRYPGGNVIEFERAAEKVKAKRAKRHS